MWVPSMKEGEQQEMCGLWSLGSFNYFNYFKKFQVFKFGFFKAPVPARKKQDISLLTSDPAVFAPRNGGGTFFF